MTPLSSPHALRPRPGGLKGWAAGRAAALMPWGLEVLRELGLTPEIAGMRVFTRYDDVLELFATDGAFAAPYRDKLRVITGGEPFFLGMGDGPAYHAGVAAMRRVMRPDDAPGLAGKVEARAEGIVQAASGRLEVVDALVRPVTFDVLGCYLGVPRPAGGDLRVWATRLFEFQFADLKNEPALRAEVDEIAPALRGHIDREIARRKTRPDPGDDVLGRCVALQAAGEPGFSDAEIRTSILCMMVGGPPQPPMVAPQALEQLLRRPDALAGAQEAARRDDDKVLLDHVLEAMRFDPLALGLPRVATRSWTVAKGTSRETEVPAGKPVLLGIAAAMTDPRRVAEPKRFSPGRPAHDYIHFGHGLHECFGRHINRATLHLMLKPLLKRPNLRRAPGRAGRLSKNGPFAERLVVDYD